MRLGNRVGPVQVENGCGNDLRLVAARIERILTGAQRLLPDAAVAGPHQRAVLELSARRVLRGQAHVSLDHRYLALFDQEHGHQLDAYQKRIERKGAVEQGVVLQPDAPAVVEEGLVVLKVVVQLILASQQPFDDLGVIGACALELIHIVEATQAVGDISGGQRVPFVGGDDANHVHRAAIFAAGLRHDTHQFQLFRLESDGCGGEAAILADLAAQLGRDGQAVDLAARNHQEADGMDGHERARRQHRPLYTLLPAPGHKVSQVGEVAELLVKDRGLGADGQRLAEKLPSIGDTESSLRLGAQLWSRMSALYVPR